MKELSIIIPAYNEEKRIEKTLRNYINFLNKTYDNNFELIVITDGCKDNTPKIVENLSKEFSCIRHTHPSERLGKGGAIIKGFKLANGNVVGFVDADGSTSCESISQLLKNLSDCDGVIASRWVNGASIKRNEPFARRIASRIFNYLVRILFGFHFKDTQCGAKFFRKKAIKSVINELGLTDWAFDVDLLYRLNRKDFKIKEVPVTWEYKEGSKLDLKRVSIKMFLSVIGLRIKTSFLGSLIPPKLISLIYRKVKSL